MLKFVIDKYYHSTLKMNNIFKGTSVEKYKKENNNITTEFSIIKKNINIISEHTIMIDKEIILLITEVDHILIREKHENILSKITEIQKIIMSCQKSLDDFLDISNNKLQDTIFFNTSQSLLFELIEESVKFNNIYEKFKNSIKDKAKREIEISSSYFTTNEIFDIYESIDRGNFSSIIFSRSLISEEHKKAQNKILYYRDIYKDLNFLESQISDIMRRFIDSLVLIYQQDNIVNNIEQNIKKTNEHIKNENIKLEDVFKKSNKCSMF